ncbi:alpha/beta fold hydrolase [Dyella sp. GSA-30]|uniref:thioesterase II family protein n=1 Tax=Dyella sp. GSA-30 TaxID=2994496 RepID=UPI002490753E|nr:alpha/beta fold hydrolase [Dyella sp. GSA-30]
MLEAAARLQTLLRTFEAAMSSSLFVQEGDSSRAAVRLFCFPYAGGNSSIYRGWQAELGSRIEVVAAELPGRGVLRHDQPYYRLDALVDDFMEQIRPLLDRPCVFFGHSNGALMCYALTLALRRHGCRLPSHLILSAKKPPHLDKEKLHSMTSEALIERLRALNGTPPEVLDNPEMMELVLPLLRADFSLSETFECPDEAPLSCGATLVGGSADAEASIGELSQWQRYLPNAGTPIVLQGDHFFVHTRRSDLLELVRNALKPYFSNQLGRAGSLPSA